MLPTIVRFSLKSIHNVDLLKITGLRPTIKCRYTRWVSRKPVAIVNEHELFDRDDTIVHNNTTIKETSKKPPKVHRKKTNVPEKKIDQEITIKEPLYKALKEDDKLISSLMIDVKTKKRREKNNQILLEGFRLIEDAIQAGATPRVIFFNRLSDIELLSLPKNVNLYKIPYRTIQLWSNLTTSPGILGIFDIPDTQAKKPADDAIPLTIICDNIREPGNMGTIVRTAAAVGCERLLLMKGCVDLWDPKVLRSATGAHFRLPIITSLSWSEIPTLISNESQLYLADNNITYNDINELTNDAVNLESDTLTAANCVNIENDLEENANKESDELNQLIKKSYKPTAKTKLFVKKIISQLPVFPYHMLDFTKKEIVLIVSGETEGVSLQSCELLRTRSCTRVNISLTNGIDSLNTASAFSIIAFEMRRQFITHKISDE